METPKAETRLSLDFSSLLGPLFFLFLIQLPLPIALSQLVYEKEKRCAPPWLLERLAGACTYAAMWREGCVHRRRRAGQHACQPS